MNSTKSPKLRNENKISSSACRTNFFSAFGDRFRPELGDHVDLQMPRADMLSRLTQYREP